MGNVLFSELFDHESNPSSEESIINLSDNCIKMLVKGVSNEKSEPPADNTDTTTTEDVEERPDDEWMKKLKVMDDVHSNTNGLTLPAVNELLDKVESQVDKIRPQVCSTFLLLLCLKKNENCMIKCKKLIDEFIDCVDKSRIEIVKEKIEAETKNNMSSGALTNELTKESDSLEIL
nr:uncharacterized protein LOC111517355 [Leptinotarsa decemlineata]